MLDKEPPAYLLVICGIISLTSLGFLIGVNNHQIQKGQFDIGGIFTVIGALATLLSIVVMLWIFYQWKSQRLNDYLFVSYLEQDAELKILKSYTSAHLACKLFNNDSYTYLDVYTKSLLKSQSKLNVINSLAREKASYDELALIENVKKYIELCDLVGRLKKETLGNEHFISFGFTKENRGILDIVNSENKFTDTSNERDSYIREHLIKSESNPFDFLYIKNKNESILKYETAEIFADLIQNKFEELEDCIKKVIQSKKFMPK